MNVEECMELAYHFAFLELRYIFLEDELAFSLDLCLLPDRMLCEQLVCSAEGGVVEDIWIAFEHVPEGRTKLRKSSLSLFLVFLSQIRSILENI